MCAFDGPDTGSITTGVRYFGYSVGDDRKSSKTNTRKRQRIRNGRLRPAEVGIPINRKSNTRFGGYFFCSDLVDISVSIDI